MGGISVGPFGDRDARIRGVYQRTINDVRGSRIEDLRLMYFRGRSPALFLKHRLHGIG
jgi:hypothetical protein